MKRGKSINVFLMDGDVSGREGGGFAMRKPSAFSVCTALLLGAACWQAAGQAAAPAESPAPHAPALTEGELERRPITWEKPVIIYNRALGREAAVKLRDRLQPYVKEAIGLYPCGKEGRMEVPLPAACTRIFLDLYYGPPFKAHDATFYRVELGCSLPEWRRGYSPFRPVAPRPRS